jgi:hypothetical protein
VTFALGSAEAVHECGSRARRDGRHRLSGVRVEEQLVELAGAPAPRFPESPTATLCRAPTTCAEYDFRTGVRNKYGARLKPSGMLVVRDPDVAEAFGDAKSARSAPCSMSCRHERRAGVAPPNQRMQLPGRSGARSPLHVSFLAAAAETLICAGRADAASD